VSKDEEGQGGGEYYGETAFYSGLDVGNMNASHGQSIASFLSSFLTAQCHCYYHSPD